MTKVGKILVVDDSRTSRIFITQSLEIAGLAGAEFVEAANGEEAWNLLQTKGPFSLLVTDINMPIKGGMDLIKDMHAQGIAKSISIIVISSTQNPARDAELKSLGALSVLEKPLKIQKLMTVVAELKKGA